MSNLYFQLPRERRVLSGRVSFLDLSVCWPCFAGVPGTEFQTFGVLCFQSEAPVFLSLPDASIFTWLPVFSSPGRTRRRLTAEP